MNNIPLYHIEFVRDATDTPIICNNSDSCSEIFHRLFDKSIVEQMAIIHLSSKNQIIGVEKVGLGNTNHVYVSMAEVFRGALLAGATSIIIGHNHPSGDPTPSDPDWDFTELVIEVATALNILVRDHIVVSPGQSHSMRSNNKKNLWFK